jgi:hypothetical protein
MLYYSIFEGLKENNIINFRRKYAEETDKKR